MTVADSPKCVAYHFKEKRKVLDYVFSTYGLDKAKGYSMYLADKAVQTGTQKRIKKELVSCASYRTLINVVDRVIRHAEQTEFTNYD